MHWRNNSIRTLILQGIVLICGSIVWMASACSALAQAVPAQRSLTLGTHLPLSGGASELAAIQQGAELWFRYINDQGGVQGRQIKVEAVDDQYQAYRAEAGVRDLILQNKAFLIFNGIGNHPHSAVADWLSALEIPDMLAGGNAPEWTFPVRRNRFTFQPTPLVEAVVLSKFIAAQHPRQPVVIWHQDSPLMKMASQQLSTLLDQQGHAVRSLSHPLEQSQFTQDIQRIKQVSPRVVVVFATPIQASWFFKTAHAEQLRSQLYGGWALADQRMIQWAGTQAMNSVRILTAMPTRDMESHPGVQLHQALIRAYNPSLVMDRWSLYGHAAAEVMTEILWRAGRKVTHASVVQAAESLDAWQGTLSPPITMNESSHIAITAFKIAEVQQGRFVPITDWISSR